MNYPNGGTSHVTPTTLAPLVPHVHAASSSGLAFTGGDALALGLIGLAVVAAGFLMWGIARLGRRHV